MTKDKDEKAVIRARMAKTGESYATAKAQLARGDAAPEGEAQQRGQLVMTHRAGEALDMAGRMGGGPWALVRALRATDGTRGTASQVLADLGVPAMSYDEVREVRAVAHRTGTATAQYGEVIAAAAELAIAEGREHLDSGTLLRACAETLRPGDVSASEGSLVANVASADLTALCRAVEKREGPENELSKDRPGLFSRFTDRSRIVIVAAQEEARELGHNCIGTEHLLLGLLKEGDGLAAQALVSRGATLEGIRERVAAVIGDVEGDAPTSHIPFTPRAKTVLEMSVEEAGALGEESIGTHHLLMALSSEGGGVASQVLTELGLTSEVVQADVLGLLRALGEPGAS